MLFYGIYSFLRIRVIWNSFVPMRYFSLPISTRLVDRLHRPLLRDRTHLTRKRPLNTNYRSLSTMHGPNWGMHAMVWHLIWQKFIWISTHLQMHSNKLTWTVCINVWMNCAQLEFMNQYSSLNGNMSVTILTMHTREQMKATYNIAGTLCGNLSPIHMDMKLITPCHATSENW